MRRSVRLRLRAVLAALHPCSGRESDEARVRRALYGERLPVHPWR